MTLSVNSTTKGFTDNDGYFITEYNADSKITSITPIVGNSVYTYQKDGKEYSYKVSASSGAVTSYSIKTKVDDNNSNTMNYNSSGILQTSVKQEGVRTTTTSYNSNAEPTVTTTGFNFGSSSSASDSVGTYYLDGTTKYYVNNTTDKTVLKYSTTYTGSNTYTDWQNHSIRSDYTSTTTYDATGKVISSGGTNISTDTDTNATNTQTDIDLTKLGVQIDSSSYTTIENSNGTHTQKSDWTNQWGTGKSETDYDAKWQVTKSTNGGTNTWTETWNNNRVITNTYSNTVTYDAAGKVIDNSGLNESRDSTTGKVTYSSMWTTADNVSVTSNNVTTVIPHVQKNTWQDENGNLGSSDYSYDANWQMLKGTGRNTYTDWNGKVIINTYTYDKDANGYHGTNTSSNGDSSKYGTTDKLDTITGNVTGHSNWSEWSNSWGTGSSSSEYDASWQNISYTSTNESIDHKNKSTYSSTNSKDSSGVLTGYIVTNSWDNEGHKGSSKIEYDTNWVVKTNTVTENGKITVYDASGNIISSSFDVTGLTGVTDATTGLVVYKITDPMDNSVTEFYMRGDALDHYNITHNSTSTSSGITIQSSDTTTFNAKGKTIERSGTTTSTIDATGTERDSSSYKIIDKFDASSVVKGHTTSSTWADRLGNSTKSTFEYNADWTKIVSSSNEYNSTYIGTDNLSHVNRTTASKVTNLDGTIIESNSWDNGAGSNGKSESVYSSALVLISKTVTDGVKITSYTYGADSAVTSTVISIDTTGLTGLFDAQSKLTAYSVTSNEGSITTYYVDGASKNVLVKYNVSNSRSTTFDTITKIDKSITTYDVKDHPLETNDTSISTYVVGTGVDAVTHTVETSSNKTLYNYDQNGTLLGLTITSTWKNENGDSDSSVEEYDASWHLLSNTVNKNGIITVYDENGLIVSSSDDVSTLGIQGDDENGFNVYSKTDVATGVVTKYYVTGTTLDHYTTTTSNGSVSNTTIFDANGKTIGNSSSGSNWSNSSSTVDNLDGTHTTENTWVNGIKAGRSTSTYDVNWNLMTSTITENGKTTFYNDKWEAISTSIDVINDGGTYKLLGVIGVSDGANTVYTLTDSGNETKYYVDTASLSTSPLVPVLVKYSNSYSGTNDLNGITSTYSGITTFDALGKMIDSSGTNASTYMVGSVVHTRDSSSYNTSTQFAGNGITVTGHTSTSTWSNESGNSGSSTNEYDANWQSIRSTSTNTSISGGHKNTSTTTLISHYTVGVVTSYTQTDIQNNGSTWNSSSNTWNTDGHEISTVKELDANWKVFLIATTENGKTTTTAYDANGNVTSTKTLIDVANLGVGVTGTGNDAVFTVHSFTDDDGSVTKYYVTAATKLVHHYTVTTTKINTWTDKVGEVTTTTDSTTFFHADGTAYGNGGTSSDSGAVTASSSYENIDNSDGTHTNKSTWSNESGSGASTTEYTADWKLSSYVNTENGKTVTTNYAADGTTVTGTTTAISTTLIDGVYALVGSDYTFNAPNGTITKYYMSGSTLDHYSVTSVGSSLVGGVTTTYSITTNFDATGKVTGNINKTSWTDTDPVVEHERLITTVDHANGSHTVTSQNTDGTTHITVSIDEYTENVAGDWIFNGRTFTENHKTTVYDSTGAITNVSFDMSGVNPENNLVDGLTVYSLTDTTDGSTTKCYYETAVSTLVPKYYIESSSVENGSYTSTKYHGNDVVDAYTIGSSIGNYSSVATYNSGWILQGTVVKDGAKTTSYNAAGGIIGTPTIDTTYVGLNQTSETIGTAPDAITYTVYTDGTIADGDTVTKYYMTGSSSLVLDHYSVSEYSVSGTDTERNTTVFGADEKVIQTETGSGSGIGNSYIETWSNTTKTVDVKSGDSITGHTVTNNYNDDGSTSVVVDEYDANWIFISRKMTDASGNIITVDKNGGTGVTENDTSTVGSLTAVRDYTTSYDQDGFKTSYIQKFSYTDSVANATGTETRIENYDVLSVTDKYTLREGSINWTFSGDNTTTTEVWSDKYSYDLDGGYSIDAKDDYTNRDGYVFHSHWIETYDADGTLTNTVTTTSGDYSVKSTNSDPTLPFDATGTDIVFTITDGSYTFNIDGFDTGDKLVFANKESAPTIAKSALTDEIGDTTYTIDVTCANATIHLTGIDSAQYESISNSTYDEFLSAFPLTV